MKILSRIKKTREIIQREKRKGRKIGFVPTMGYLHEGHCSLIRRSKKENDLTILSIFVNPAQFAPHEDFRQYPRDKKRDETLAKKENVDIIFYPSAEKMYPDCYLTYVNTENWSNRLCGKYRPGHFRGVTTVVCKLLNIVTPDVLYLGQKDLQQAVIIKKMIQDLNVGVKTQICPIIREDDGLAKSSRNTYLNAIERKEAAVLYQALQQSKKMIRLGERNWTAIRKQCEALIGKTHARKVDYIECLSYDNLEPRKKIQGKCFIALAVWFGKTRLIDNIVVNIK